MPSGVDRPRRRSATWLGDHKQRILYALAATSLCVALAAGVIGGFRLHHAADVERQALRTQELAGAAAELEDFPTRAESEGVSRELVADERNALATTNARFRMVGAHDAAEGGRLRETFLAYVKASTNAFQRAAAGQTATRQQQANVERALIRFQSLIAAETSRLAAESRVTNPKARTALITAAGVAGLLVIFLVLQFELQRRAGRIDRDNARRSHELSQLREEFVATVSHELRTPLTSIIGYLDLIDDTETTNLTEEQRGFLTIVQRNADRLHDLVGDLLLVAEADGGRLALDVQAVDLDALASTCVESARPAADARQIELTLVHGGVHEIHGDPVRLEQMMDNLISNAIKFTPVGGRVAVRTVANHSQALFEVSDTGPGISTPDQAHLFDRFFRTRDAIDQAVKGTG
ncbi:MAG TPA: HAMP domain-containing sensor histidine kinase, partial [Gaiellaceae bacterium]